MDAFDHLQYYHLIKVNIFNLFDYSTVAHEMVQTQKILFAQKVIVQVNEAHAKTLKNLRELENVLQIVEN